MKPIYITQEDIAWLSVKLNSHFVNIKKSDVLTDEEKQIEIDILMRRAHRFGMSELIERMGYTIYKIPLSKNREAELIIPKNPTSDDVEIIKKRLEFQLYLLNPTNP